jgi:hypothetical protein
MIARAIGQHLRQAPLKSLLLYDKLLGAAYMACILALAHIDRGLGLADSARSRRKTVGYNRGGFDSEGPHGNRLTHV